MLEKVCKEKDINKIKEVIENIKLNEREFQIIEAYAKNRNRIKQNDELFIEYCLLKGLLHRLDHSSSAEMNVEENL